MNIFIHISLFINIWKIILFFAFITFESPFKIFYVTAKRKGGRYQSVKIIVKIVVELNNNCWRNKPTHRKMQISKGRQKRAADRIWGNNRYHPEWKFVARVQLKKLANGLPSKEGCSRDFQPAGFCDPPGKSFSDEETSRGILFPSTSRAREPARIVSWFRKEWGVPG